MTDCARHELQPPLDAQCFSTTHAAVGRWPRGHMQCEQAVRVTQCNQAALNLQCTRQKQAVHTWSRKPFKAMAISHLGTLSQGVMLRAYLTISRVLPIPAAAAPLEMLMPGSTMQHQ